MIDHSLLEAILRDASKNPEFLEEVLEHTSMTNRIILQLYITFKFFHTWKKQNPKLTFEEANNIWTTYPDVPTSLAAKFAEIYQPESKIPELYTKLELYAKEQNIFQK